MSNRTLAVRLPLLAACVACAALVGCSSVRQDDPERPHAAAAEDVVRSVAAHTRMSGGCRKLAALAVEAAIIARTAEYGDEAGRAEEAEATVASVWEKGACPVAAVPGLSFGAAQYAADLKKGAHRSASLR